MLISTNIAWKSIELLPTEHFVFHINDILPHETVIVISEFLAHHSKAKHKRAPAYSRAL